MSDDDERMKNFILFNTYSTDSEVEEIAPVVIGAVILIAIGLFIWSVVCPSTPAAPDKPVSANKTMEVQK